MSDIDPRTHDFDQRKDGPDQQPTENDSAVKEKQSVDLGPADQPHTDTESEVKEKDEVKEQDSDDHGLEPQQTPKRDNAVKFTEGVGGEQDDGERPGMGGKSRSLPEAINTNVRKSSTGFSGHHHHHTPTDPRKSIELSKLVRPSGEFDLRYDGPFGRPSVSMNRRRSTGGMLSSPTADNGDNADAEPPTPVVRRSTQPDANDNSLEPTDSAYEPEPPPLNYTLRTRKLSICIWWSMILFDSVAMPIALYFGLWYGVGPGARDGMHRLSANTVWSIITAALGGASILDYFLRFWRLFKKNSTCRVLGARRWYLDFFHWNFSLAWIIIMVELIVGTVQTYPPIRLVAMPLTTMLWVFGTELIIMDFYRWREWSSPVRLSSVPRGAQVRPGIYTLIEDICAVDGSGGTEFREALNRRYEASHIFRSMLRRLGLFWSISAELTAAVCTILIFTITGDAAYTVGWSVPFVWAGVWTLCTFWYVKRELKKEKIVWAEEAAAKANA